VTAAKIQKVQNDVATHVYLRHLHERLWYRDGQWCDRREDALPFSSKEAAMVVCNGARLSGVLVGVNASGNDVYFLKTDALEAPTSRASAQAA
jgi:hypothetical protein